MGTEIGNELNYIKSDTNTKRSNSATNNDSKFFSTKNNNNQGCLKTVGNHINGNYEVKTSYNTIDLINNHMKPIITNSGNGVHKNVNESRNETIIKTGKPSLFTRFCTKIGKILKNVAVGSLITAGVTAAATGIAALLKGAAFVTTIKFAAIALTSLIPAVGGIILGAAIITSIVYVVGRVTTGMYNRYQLRLNTLKKLKDLEKKEIPTREFTIKFIKKAQENDSNKFKIYNNEKFNYKNREYIVLCYIYNSNEISTRAFTITDFKNFEDFEDFIDLLKNYRKEDGTVKNVSKDRKLMNKLSNIKN